MQAYWTPPFLFDPIPVRLVANELVGEFGVVPVKDEIVLARDPSSDEAQPWTCREFLARKGYKNVRVARESEIYKGAFPCV